MIRGPFTRATFLFIIGVSAATMGLLLAWSAQLLHLGIPGMSPAGLDQIELLRDALLGVVLPACATAALGRLATEEHASSILLGRVDTLSGFAGLTGAAVIVASCCFGEHFGSFLGIGVAIVALAAVIDALSVLARDVRRPGSFFATSARAAAAATLVVMPLVVAAMGLLVAERYTHLDLWRDHGGDAWLGATALHDAMIGFAPIALLCGGGAVLDALLEQVEGEVAAAASTRAAFYVLALFGAIASGAKLFGGVGSAALAVFGLFSLALVVPATVIVGNLLATLAAGRWLEGRVRWAALAALVILVERCALAAPAMMSGFQGLFDSSSLAAAAEELGLVAIVFSVISAAPELFDRLVPRATPVGLALFSGAQLALLARVSAAMQTRAIPSLPELTVVERVTAIGLALGLFAVAIALTNALRGLRARVGRD